MIAHPLTEGLKVTYRLSFAFLKALLWLADKADRNSLAITDSGDIARSTANVRADALSALGKAVVFRFQGRAAVIENTSLGI